MRFTLGWLLLAGLPLPRHLPIRDTVSSARPPAQAAGRVTVWTDRDEPYRRGDGARVYLDIERPSYVAVFRVDTDGRIRVLLPHEPWTDTYLHDQRELEVGEARGGRSFVVDDDPGMGYLFAVAATEPLDFRDVTRGDSWDYRLIDGGRIQGDPYVALTDLAARIAPHGDYDYDIVPYYVEHRYDYPRFVCYDCHAYAGYQEWNPYSQSCTRYQVVVRDDPRYYPYRYGGRNVVAARLAHPGPRYIFRDADPRRPALNREDQERTLRRREAEQDSDAPQARPLTDERRRLERRRQPEPEDSTRGSTRRLRPANGSPESTGEPELHRRRP
jgi:hypothetical protein